VSVGHRSAAWRCGRHWLEFLQSCPSSPATIVSDLKTSTRRFRPFNLGRRNHELHRLLTTVAGRLGTPVDDGFVRAVCAGHQWKVHLGIVDQAVVPPGLEHPAEIVVSEGYAEVFGALIPRRIDDEVV
jgi:hypothetical protein